MLQYILRRLLEAVPILLGVTVVTFLILHLAPGDPAILIGGPTASKAEIENIRKRLQLDRSLPEQYFTFLGNLVQGDLGESIQRREKVSNMIKIRLPHTVALAIGAMIVTLLGIPIGILAARYHNSLFDLSLVNLSLVGLSVPSFWLGLLFIIWFSVDRAWFPAAGLVTPYLSGKGINALTMPAITLGVAGLGLVARLTRSGMLEVLKQDYIRTARAKGVGERTVLYRHALRNTLIPVITVLGVNFGNLLGGAVATETVFAINGIGRLTVDSILSRDFAVVQGCVVLIAAIFVVVNLLVDLSYAMLNPQVRYG